MVNDGLVQVVSGGLVMRTLSIMCYWWSSVTASFWDEKHAKWVLAWIVFCLVVICGRVERGEINREGVRKLDRGV